MHREVPTGSQETELSADQFASAFLLPKTAFAREFRTRRFSWEHVFEIKRHWQVSAAAIVRRARDLGFMDETSYRRAFQHMSFMKWRTEGEPYEPQFQEPELFLNALNALGNGVSKTILELCADLNLSPKTFADVTGFVVDEVEGQGSASDPQAQGKLLTFPSRAIAPRT
jgi:Zn-dependent peptidase ImmA (M78 family)